MVSYTSVWYTSPRNSLRVPTSRDTCSQHPPGLAYFRVHVLHVPRSMALIRFISTLRKHSVFARLTLAKYACTRILLASYLVFPTGFTCACAPVHICRVYLYVCSCVHLSSSQVQSSCYTLQLYFLMSNANYTSTRMVFARRA